MILTFSRDLFVEKIKNRTKYHTIRQDKNNRWQPGKKIHFWRGNPRNVKLNPYGFGTGICRDVQSIEIYPAKNMVKIAALDDKENHVIYTDTEDLNALAVNDGFSDWQQMKAFFTEDFKGKLIYFVYEPGKEIN